MSLNVLVAGASGFLGTHLTQVLEARGHTVTPLVRREPEAGQVRWDPEAGEVPQDAIEAADVVVNLAGSPTAGNPHSASWARELRESRVRGTATLADAIAASDRKPAFLAGNGISYYGDHGRDPLDETADSRGDALLTDVTRDWQAATEPARAAGARVCILRTSPVLDDAAPPLQQLVWIFKLGLGARLGPGNQYFPCISLRDWTGAVAFLAEDERLSGPVNLCCPSTPTNAEFTAALASAVGRRARLFVPTPVLSVGAGRMAPELLNSVNAVPRVLLDAGFDFADVDIRDILATALR
ncbi:TIGR01777 family oxidoreductase [Nocardioides rotundus]|uniref:TIGR01777 family oxidoreductase n=1 Tax=Nocardioides rotundus TaxID=1774216 RepID=UPI001CC17ED7|nr:TIGR01777 family oxidoreductase [Nocardioides rotundus]UAL31190.1 TIGR01777 family oxidoreductase [Nocardioides rotundus]